MRSVTTILVATLVIAMSSVGGAGARGYHSEMNHPSYWGDNCVKFENFTNEYYYSTSSDDTSLVVIKAAKDNAVYDDGEFKNLSSPINEKNGKAYAISHVIECYDDADTDPKDEPKHDDEPEHDYPKDDEPKHEDPKNDNPKPEDKPNVEKVWLCHWTEGVNGYILINPASAGADHGHLGNHHHHGKDFVTTEYDGCAEVEEPQNCDDQIYYQHNLNECDPEDPQDPQDPEDPDEPEVLGDTDGKGGGELANTGATETFGALAAAGLVGTLGLAAIPMSKKTLAEELSEIAL